ncbi:benzoate/H(+) symporter BenE family transporter [Undibacterium griseum]|uniref:Benzoate/H(+) symporter BenE family transporter n=1 Tax=Undibacterium griseum TaxID=2762295 RepID=A0ABR6YQR5_9BURK|nr:benzoate/H(+) symporter BenE family transporter [Undibacterium griseum]MBC3886245.1 benzoate/H(+) symporter BenE family transporter [Undibacterium griseum]
MTNSPHSLLKDWSFSATVAGFLAVLISYSGPLVIFFQAAHSAHATPEMTASWVWAISAGAGISGILLSWYLKTPVITAWSAPGTALLVSLFPAMPLSQAVAAYITSAIVILLIGLSGYFDKLIRQIPKGIAAGMMAGILFQFGVNSFKSVTATPVLAIGMILTYLAGKKLLPRYAIVLVLLAGALLAWITHLADLSTVHVTLSAPVWITPEWTWQSTLSFALPLILVSLSGQFLPGMAILRLSGYQTPARPILIITSLLSVIVAFFGGITIVIAAITAALCTGKDAHEHAGKRYIAGIANGVFYLIGGALAATIVALFTSLPKEFVAVLAGLALLGAISTNIMGVIQDEEHREASMITFLATASGMTLFGLGSAFWGIVIGIVAYLILHHKPAAE